MNHLLTTPHGIDIPIQKAQTAIYDGLLSEWGDIGLKGYGRVYKNVKDDEVIPEYFKSNKDYSGNLISRESKFFFTKSASSEHQGRGYEYSSSVNIYFIIDLSKARPSITHRADQEVQSDILWMLEVSGLEVKAIVDTGSEDVFSEFRGAVDKAKFDDMQPFHVFRCECGIIYDLNK